MKKTVITDDLIVFSDGFVWKRLSRKAAEALWNSVISHELELIWFPIMERKRYSETVTGLTQQRKFASVCI